MRFGSIWDLAWDLAVFGTYHKHWLCLGLTIRFGSEDFAVFGTYLKTWLHLGLTKRFGCIWDLPWNFAVCGTYHEILLWKWLTIRFFSPDVFPSSWLGPKHQLTIRFGCIWDFPWDLAVFGTSHKIWLYLGLTVRFGCVGDLQCELAVSKGNSTKNITTVIYECGQTVHKQRGDGL